MIGGLVGGQIEHRARGTPGGLVPHLPTFLSKASSILFNVGRMQISES